MAVKGLKELRHEICHSQTVGTATKGPIVYYVPGGGVFRKDWCIKGSIKTAPAQKEKKYIVIFLNFPCPITCLLCCLLMSFVFAFFLWLGICVEVDVDRITI